MGGQSSQQAIMRINSELKGLQKNPPRNWNVYPHWLNWNKWRIQIIAEPSCPFHSLPFYLLVEFDANYPKSKPTLRLEKPELFYHPNINDNGEMCQNKLLNQIAQNMTIRDRIQTFITVLSNPNFNNPVFQKTPSAAGDEGKNNFMAYYRKANKIFRGELKKK